MVTRDELIRMAVEAGLAYKTGSRWWIDAGEVDIHLERFAELVRQDLYQVIGKSVIEQINSAVQIERQACAAVADEFDDDVGQAISKAIRARGNT